MNYYERSEELAQCLGVQTRESLVITRLLKVKYLQPYLLFQVNGRLKRAKSGA